MSPDQLKTLRSGRLWYLATVYSKWQDGPDDAFVVACRFAAGLIRDGVPVLSPIAHSHPIAIHGGLDELDHDLWMKADAPLMDAASGLLVLMMPGWRESRGIAQELDSFTRAGKPIEFVEWRE